MLTKSNSDTWALCFLGLIFTFRLVYAHFLGVIPDETYYWDWSRELSCGYFDHPPMIAWLIYLSRLVFGESTLGIRFSVLACSSIATFSSYLLLKNYVTKPWSLMFFLAMSNSIILFGVGTILATPDVPLILFWSLALLFGYRAVFDKSTFSWLLLGIFSGCGLLSKYTFALFFLSFFLFLIFSKQSRRRWLLCWQPYAALLISMLVWLPNILWNARHGWISFLFQFSHGLGSDGFPNFHSFGEFIGGQIGVLSVFPFILLVIASVSLVKIIRTNDQAAYLAAFLFVPFFLFFASSLQKRVEANWAAAAYVTGVMVMALFWDNLDGIKNRRMRRFALFSVGIAALTTGAVLWHIQKPFLPLSEANDPASQVRGWKDWSQEVNTIRKHADPDLRLPLCTNRYQETSMLGFQLPDHPQATALCIGARENTYVLFGNRTLDPAQKVIFIHPDQESVFKPPFTNVFLSIDKIGTATLRQGPNNITPYAVYVAVLAKKI